VAAALLRQFRAGRSAPEELRDAHEPKKAPRERVDFADGVWISLSVGRKQQAEPRWLIPMLCKTTPLTSKDIGAIRAQYTETFVEVAAPAIDGFMAALEGGMLEKTVVVKRLEGKPDLTASQPSPDFKKKPPRKDGPKKGYPKKAAGKSYDPADDSPDKPRPKKKPFKAKATSGADGVLKRGPSKAKKKKAK